MYPASFWPGIFKFSPQTPISSSGVLEMVAAFSTGEQNGAVGPGCSVSEPNGVPEGLRYVARQPILTARGNVHGYELLFRAGAASSTFDGDGDAATRTVLDNTVIFGLERLTGGLPVFVNCTEEALLGGFVKILPPESTVLEILETVTPSECLVRTCLELKSLGYRIALDDFVWSPAWQPMLEIADYVKLDLTQTTREQRSAIRAKLHGRKTQLILERVETRLELAESIAEGFDLFQGFYFCHPELIHTRNIPPNRMVHIQIMQAVLTSPLDIKQISSLIKREPSLTYRLLRIANSPNYATRHGVTSIQGALVMIGDDMFRRLVMLATAIECRGDQPGEVLRMAFLRGRFCELTASMTGQDPTEQYLVGLLSLVPAMLGAPMESISRALPLRREVRDALLGKNNAQRALLNWLLRYEAGDWAQCDELARAATLNPDSLPRLYADALRWAEINMSLANG
jgi:EAL and modified HD-GYP domain-containing signal transduction protein